RPARHEERVRDQHARRRRCRPEHADGLAALDEQRLILGERQERPDERAERREVAAERLDRGLERARRAHSDSCSTSRSAARSRWRSRHQVHPVASTAATAPPRKDRTKLLPVAYAITTTRMPRPLYASAASR